MPDPRQPTAAEARAAAIARAPGEFAASIRRTAERQLRDQLASPAGRQAVQDLALAFMAACRIARDPGAFIACTEASVADAVATSIRTGLSPGGPNPTVYLVPQAPRKGEQPELQWRITHRGLAVLASRAGLSILPVPVGRTDEISVAYGEVAAHAADPTAWPMSLPDMLGVCVVVRRVSDGLILCRVWCPRQAIEARANRARDQSVWCDWPIEMAQKTAIKWAFSRGMIPLDTPEIRSALDADGSADHVVDAAATERPPTARELLLPDREVEQAAEQEQIAALTRAAVAADVAAQDAYWSDPIRAQQAATPRAGVAQPPPLPAPPSGEQGPPENGAQKSARQAPVYAPCSGCGRLISLTKGGVIREHGEQGAICAGSGKPPAPERPAAAAPELGEEPF